MSGDRTDHLRSLWDRICADLVAAGRRPVDCLFRSTEGFNVPVVLEHGTDRHGRTSPDFGAEWASAGFRGAPVPFARALFASTAAEIERQLRTGRGDTALSKCPGTPDGHLLIYRRGALRRIHVKQHAFRTRLAAEPRVALLAIYDAAPESLGAPAVLPLERG